MAEKREQSTGIRGLPISKLILEWIQCFRDGELGREAVHDKFAFLSENQIVVRTRIGVARAVESNSTGSARSSVG